MDTDNSSGAQRYNAGMSMQVDAVYAHGVLTPLQPLDLAEDEHVRVVVTQISRAASACQPDVEFAENLARRLKDAGPAPGLDEVRRRLSKIPGTLTADFSAGREDR